MKTIYLFIVVGCFPCLVESVIKDLNSYRKHNIYCIDSMLEQFPQEHGQLIDDFLHKRKKVLRRNNFKHDLDLLCHFVSFVDNMCKITDQEAMFNMSFGLKNIWQERKKELSRLKKKID